MTSNIKNDQRNSRGTLYQKETKREKREKKERKREQTKFLPQKKLFVWKCEIMMEK